MAKVAEKSGKSSGPKSAKKSSPKVMDVAKPGKSVPTATSRPVIVGHKAILQDPMMSGKGTSGDTPVLDESVAQKITVTRGNKVVKPLTTKTKSKAKEAAAEGALYPSDPQPEEVSAASKPDDTAPDPLVQPDVTVGPGPEVTPDGASSPEASKASAPSEPIAEEEPESAPDIAHENGQSSAEAAPADGSSETPKEENTATAPESDDAAAVGAVAEQANKQKKEKALTEQEKRKAEEVDKLVADKKYFVPIGQATKKRRARWSLLILLVLVALVGGYAAVDAQLMPNSIQLPYEFFKEKAKEDTSDQTESPVTAKPSPTKPDTTDTEPQPTKPAYTGQIVQPTGKAYGIKIPDGWKIKNAKTGNFLYAATSADLVYRSGTPPTVTATGASTGDSVLSFVVNQFTDAEPLQLLDGDEQKTSITVNGIKGTRYYKQYPVKQPTRPGPLAGQKQYTYIFKKGKTTTYIGYAVLQKNQFAPTVTKSDTNYIELVEKAVRTLEIK